MRTQLIFALVLTTLAGALGHSRAAASQQISACRGPDAISSELIEQVARFAAANPADAGLVEGRDSLGLVSVAESEIVLVSTDSICQHAAAAYTQQIPAGLTDRLSGRVYVVQAGPRYVVLDPSYYYSEPGPLTKMVFDENFGLLTIFL